MCEGPLIQTQSDIIINTNKITKVIENQMMVNEKIERKTMKKSTDQVIGDIKCITNESTKLKERVAKLEGSFEQYSDSDTFASELSSMQVLFDEQVNGVVEIEKNCRTQIKSIKKENFTFFKMVMDEIWHTSEKIEELKITILTDKINKSIITE